MRLKSQIKLHDMKGRQEMNDLNSVLLEGQILVDPKRLEREGKKDLLVFTIQFKKQVKIKDNIETQYNYFKVESTDNGTEFKAGDYIRVVGTLKLRHVLTTVQEVRIHADHIEIKPVRSKKNE